ncbi:MAG: GNAT family N-acetyltransferase [Caldimonas sp.]
MALSDALVRDSQGATRAALRLVALTHGDIEAGLALSDAAGWNQTADDWALFMERGHAIGFRDDASRLVATAAALPYGASAGWISMVLVADAWRHRGLASDLMGACIDRLRAARVVPFLDATPAGAAVYARLGFAGGFEIDRWEWRASTSAAAIADDSTPPDARSLDAAGSVDLDAIAALDRAATGIDRRFLLESFLARPDTRAWLSGEGEGSGFVIARAGRRATQIGPLVANNTSQAIALLASAFASARAVAGRSVLLDLPRCRVEVAAWLEAHGFVRQRPFVRMSLGATHVPAPGDTSFILAGPEFG